MNALKQAASCRVGLVARLHPPASVRRLGHEEPAACDVRRISSQGQAPAIHHFMPHATELTLDDSGEVEAFLSSLTPDTLSELEGSRCMLRSECAGSRDSHAFQSAVQQMVSHFRAAVGQSEGARGACLGLRGPDGALAGICLLRPTQGEAGVCRTYGLVIGDAWQGMGLGPRLKAAQLAHAQRLGFHAAEIHLDLSDMKGVTAADQGAAELPIVKLQRKTARLTGFALTGPQKRGDDAMVLSFDLRAKK